MENGSSINDSGNDVMAADVASDAAAGGDFQPGCSDAMKVRFFVSFISYVFVFIRPIIVDIKYFGFFCNFLVLVF